MQPVKKSLSQKVIKPDLILFHPHQDNLVRGSSILLHPHPYIYINIYLERNILFDYHAPVASFLFPNWFLYLIDILLFQIQTL